MLKFCLRISLCTFIIDLHHENSASEINATVSCAFDAVRNGNFTDFHFVKLFLQASELYKNVRNVCKISPGVV